MSEELRRAFYESSANSLDFEAYIPDLHGVTEILTEDHRKHLSRHLPARAEGKNILLFSLVLICALAKLQNKSFGNITPYLQSGEGIGLINLFEFSYFKYYIISSICIKI